MNIGGSFTGSIPTAGALSRTVLQDATGGNTQVLIMSSVCLIFSLSLSPSVSQFHFFIHGSYCNSLPGIFIWTST